MDFYKPVRFLFGECVYSTDARGAVRLSNAFADEKIRFRLEKEEQGRVQIRLPLLAAERAEAVARGACAVLKPCAKRGLPFMFAGFLRRPGLIAGAFAALGLLFFSQLFVWRVNVEGNRTVQSGKITAALEKCGVGSGTFIPRVDPAEKANELLMLCKSISSAELTFNGSELTVAVLERTPAPEVVDRTGYYNVVAAYDGIITDIDAADGTPEAKAGDVVAAGQLLINSFMEGKYGTFCPVHARGRVMADVRKKFCITVPAEREIKDYTGNTCTKRELRVLGAGLPLYFSPGAPYEYFDCVYGVREPKLFGFVELPAVEYVATYMEYVPRKVTLSAAEAERTARAELELQLAQYDCVVKECEIKIYRDEKSGACILEADAVLNIDIAREIPLEINDYGAISERLPSARE